MASAGLGSLERLEPNIEVNSNANSALDRDGFVRWRFQLTPREEVE
jgi:hypothetical protein